jgi:hypothetical protein
VWLRLVVVRLALLVGRELMPVPVIDGVVALAVTEKLWLALVVRLLDTGAECVWIAVVPFSVHSVV